MTLSKLNALTSEVVALAASLEDWMLDYCGGNDDAVCDLSTAAAMVNLMTEIKAMLAEIKAAYADGFTLDRAVFIAESVVRGVEGWLSPA